MEQRYGKELLKQKRLYRMVNKEFLIIQIEQKNQVLYIEYMLT